MYIQGKNKREHNIIHEAEEIFLWSIFILRGKQEYARGNEYQYGNDKKEYYQKKLGLPSETDIDIVHQ